MNTGRNIRTWVAANSTDDCVFYASAVGDGDLRGRDAMTHILEQFVSQAAPRYRVDGDLVEHGNFAVAFLVAESRTTTANVCELYSATTSPRSRSALPQHVRRDPRFG